MIHTLHILYLSYIEETCHMNVTKLSFLVIFVPLLWSTSINAQDKPINKIPSIGILANFTIVEETLPSEIGGGYAPTILQVNYRIPFLKKTGKHQLALLLQPQFNLVKAIPNQPSDFLFEAGINLGLAYEYLISPNFGIAYLGLGAGPHYINAETGIQANGFIFSDNFYAGLHQFVGNKTWFLTYEIRFRHISNAGLQEPNIGIDNFFLGIGVSYFIFN